MKFGKTLIRNQIPEWTPYYINYKALKQEIKTIAGKSRLDGNTVCEEDIAPLLFSLDRQVEIVDGFFNKHYGDNMRLLRIIVERHPEFRAVVPESTLSILKAPGCEYIDRTLSVSEFSCHSEEFDEDPEELNAIYTTLVDLKNQLKNLSWYAELNRKAFIKILKKVDKKLGTFTQRNYLETKIFVLPFASNDPEGEIASIHKAIQLINLVADHLNSLLPNEATRQLSSTARDNVQVAHNGLSSIDGANIKREKTPSEQEEVRKLIAKNDSDSLDKLFSNLSLKRPYFFSQKNMFSFLIKAVMQSSISTIPIFLSKLKKLEDPSDYHHRNAIHNIVISLGRMSAAKSADNKSSTFTPGEVYSSQLFGTMNFGISDSGLGDLESLHGCDGFRYILDSLSESDYHYLVDKDDFSRTPLHYAAQYGLLHTSEIILEYMNKWKLFTDTTDGTSTPLYDAIWQDNDGYTPLHLSILGTHPRTTKVLADALIQSTETVFNYLNETKLLLAVVSINNEKVIEMIDLLLNIGFDVDYKDSERGECALFIASKMGYIHIVEYLVTVGFANTGLTEPTFGWTPLFIAASEGFNEIVQILVDSGADVNRLDFSGWTAKEHACLRGKIATAEMINSIILPSCGNSPGDHPHHHGKIDEGYFNLSASGFNARKSGYLGNHNLGSDESITYKSNSMGGFLSPPLHPFSASDSLLDSRVSPNLDRQFVNGGTLSKPDPVKSFGHRYLKDKTMVLITLGSSNARESLKSIELNLLSLPNLHNTGLDTALSLVISATNTDDEPTILDLPIHDEIQSTEPISFSTSDHSLKDVRVMFDIVPTYSIAPKKVLGRAVALIPSLSKNFPAHRRSLMSTMTIPIVQLGTLDFLGTINFELLIIKPFYHPNMGVEKSNTYWKTLSTNPVIGHRGNGMNLTDKRSLQLGENTMESFIAASNLGASYVELDVQLTKDMKPVIYHDFLVSETGFDCPVHALTLEQFLAIKSKDKHYLNGEIDNSETIFSTENLLEVSDLVSGNNSRLLSPLESSSGIATPANGIKKRLGRSLSLQSFSDPTKEWKELMKNTRDFKNKGFKPNSRGLTITSPFTSLLEVLTTLPKSIGINIECKYPMLDESQQEDMEAYAIELNSWVDTVLRYVYEYGEGRDILLSSFHPDVCIMLVMKQPSIPVLFLTEAGVTEMADIRARSLQEAIRFAKRWNLLGIIPDSKAIITCPRLIKVVKQSGLVLFTYGHLNSKPELASLQIKYGVDAVISDSVLGVRKELTMAG